MAAWTARQILWTIALFFGCSILFRAIDAVASDSGKGVSLGIQAAVLCRDHPTIVLVGAQALEIAG